jgi:hypothetical protein
MSAKFYRSCIFSASDRTLVEFVGTAVGNLPSWSTLCCTSRSVAASRLKCTFGVSHVSQWMPLCAAYPVHSRFIPLILGDRSGKLSNLQYLSVAGTMNGTIPIELYVLTLLTRRDSLVSYRTLVEFVATTVGNLPIWSTLSWTGRSAAASRRKCTFDASVGSQCPWTNNYSLRWCVLGYNCISLTSRLHPFVFVIAVVIFRICNPFS